MTIRILPNPPAGPMRSVGDAQIKTGTGNDTTISVEESKARSYGPGDLYSTDNTVRIALTDRGYFRGADHVDAYVGVSGYVAHHGGRPTNYDETLKSQVRLEKGAGGTYQGQVDFALESRVADTEQYVKEVKVAFYNEDRWDSNMGANYRAPFYFGN